MISFSLECASSVGCKYAPVEAGNSYEPVDRCIKGREKLLGSAMYARSKLRFRITKAGRGCAKEEEQRWDEN